MVLLCSRQRQHSGHCDLSFSVCCSLCVALFLLFSILLCAWSPVYNNVALRLVSFSQLLFHATPCAIGSDHIDSQCSADGLDDAKDQRLKVARSNPSFMAESYLHIHNVHIHTENRNTREAHARQVEKAEKRKLQNFQLRSLLTVIGS